MLRRLGGLFRRVPGADEQKALERMSIVDVIDAHMRWKLSLQNYLNGTSLEGLNPAVLRCPETSLTGKWIDVHAGTHCSAYGAFFTARARHAQCHLLAADIVEQLLAGNHDAAAELMNARLVRVSRELIYALMDLDRQLMKRR